MKKRCISSLLAICIIFGLGIFPTTAEATSDEASIYMEETQSVSGNGEGNPMTPGLLAPTETPTPNMQGRIAIDGTNADGTLDLSDGVNTNLLENSSKYNGMAATPTPETPALSRYSTRRVTLSPDIVGTRYEEAAELLGALGIMVGDAESGAFRPADNIIRSEMAKVAVYSVGLEDIAKGSMNSTRFPDVPADHWATGAINVADQQGMILGDDVGTFRPDDPVLLQEAVTIMVRAMGYQPAAEEKGGYPTGYLYVASNNQLFRGLSGNANAPATRGDIAQLIFNALTVNLMEQTGFGSTTSYEVVDKTLLYDRLNVEKGYGQITATSETALDGGSTTDRDMITIDKKFYKEGDTGAKQLLGYNVLYYARLDKKTDDKTLINVRPQENKNKVIVANSDDIVSVAGDADAEKTFEYWASPTDSRAKSVTISDKAVYIYNGKHKANVPLDALKPTAGNVTLLDADFNGVYEIVFVNHMTNLVVDTISTVTGRVTDKYLNGSLVFDKNQETVQFSLIKNGAEIGVEDLAEWNVISYTISDDKNLIKGYVSEDSVTGMVTEATADGYRIGEGDELYKKAANYPGTIALRDKGTFYLDAENKIAAVNTSTTVGTDQNQNKKYGYLIGVAMNDSFESTVQFRIFTMAGETQIFTSTNKMRLNDRYGQEPTTVMNTLIGGGTLKPQLVVYETNSNGNINAIETATDNTASGTPNTEKFTLNIRKDDMIYKTASGKLDNVTISDKTIIFDIPATAGTDTEKYSIRTKNTLSNDASYDAIIYDLQENYEASVVVITSSVGITAPESPILVVDHIGATQNEDFEDTDRVYGWQSGKEVNFLATDKSVFLKPGGSGTVALSKGDIIQYRTNSKGEIDDINLLFDSSAKNTEFTNKISDDLTCVYGRVTRKFSGSVNMTINGVVRNFTVANDTLVYLYDSTRNKSDIQVVTPADIEIFEEGNEARLFVKIYDDVVQEMVIVK